MRGPNSSSVSYSLHTDVNQESGETLLMRDNRWLGVGVVSNALDTKNSKGVYSEGSAKLDIRRKLPNCSSRVEEASL